MLSILITEHLFISILGLTFIIMDAKRKFCVRNTMERYRLASWCKVLQYPALVWGPMGIALNSIRGDWSLLIVPIDILLTYVILKRVQEFRADDDEDFWSKLGKKLRKKLKSSLRQVKEALAPNPVLQPIPIKY